MHVVNPSRNATSASMRRSSRALQLAETRVQSPSSGCAAGQFGERVADLLQAEPDVLRGADEGEAAQRLAPKTSLSPPVRSR